MLTVEGMNYYTRAEFGKKLDVCRSTVIRWGHAGKVHPVVGPDGKTLYYPESDVKALTAHMVVKKEDEAAE